jgi:hypothetical protein
MGLRIFPSEPGSRSTSEVIFRGGFTPLFCVGSLVLGQNQPRMLAGDPWSLNGRYGLTHRSINCGVPFWEGRGAVFGGPVSVRDGRETPTAYRSQQFAKDSREQDTTRLGISPRSRHRSSRRESRSVSRGTSCRCGGGFAKQVAGKVEKGETATLLRERLEIRPDENLDGLLAGINLDTNRRVAKGDLMAASVRSSNDGMGHWIWLSEINGGGLAKRLSSGQSRDVSSHFTSISQG